MKEYRSATVINHGNGMSDSTVDSVHGPHKISTGPSETRIDGNAAVSSFVRTSKMSQTLQDDFDTVRGSKNLYVGGDYTIRIDGRLNIIAGNTDKKAPIQQEWMDATADLAAARAAGEVKRGFIPLGYDSAAEPRSGEFASDPQLQSKYISTNSTSNGLNSDPVSGIATASRGSSSVKVGSWAKGNSKSPSTQGGTFDKNEVDIPALMTETQGRLTEIERNMTRNDIPLVGDNLIIATSGPPNNRPPGRVDPIGRAERKAIKINSEGPSTEYVGVPHIEEVDNYSDIPFGNINIKAGNNFTVEVGNGGVNLVTGGGIKIIGGANTIVGGEQVLVAGKGNVRINAGSFVGVKAANIDLDSPAPITMNNLAVHNGAMFGGGVYVNGELFVNHITAPKELQKTLEEPEFTYGEPVTGQIIAYAAGIPCIAVATPSSIKIYKHKHWFENLPLTLGASNSDVRNAAAKLNNGGTVAATVPTDAS